MKRCNKCKEDKDLSKFSKKTETRDGYDYWCKKCTSERNRAYYKKNPALVKARCDRYRQSEIGKKKTREIADKWSKKNKKAHICHIMVGKAIAHGVITPQPCQVCGQKKPVHAHHPDYDRPFDVIWLCPLHHNTLYHKAKLRIKE